MWVSDAGFAVEAVQRVAFLPEIEYDPIVPTPLFRISTRGRIIIPIVVGLRCLQMLLIRKL